jgi:hypothetical protein
MENLQKSLAELIDETLAEIEQLKKSDRYSAHEVELGDAKANGKMEVEAVKKGDDEDKDDEKEDEAKKSDDEDEDDEDGEDDDMEKAEKDCMKADEDAAKAMKKYEMCKAEAEHKKKMLAMKKGEWAKKADEDKKEEKKDDKDEEKDLKKSLDARVAPLEAKIADVLAAVKKLSDQPVPARGHSFRSIQPLAKSNEVEPMSKSTVFNKLFDLKKSNPSSVATEDFVELDQGTKSPDELAAKYGLK